MRKMPLKPIVIPPVPRHHNFTYQLSGSNQDYNHNKVIPEKLSSVKNGNDEYNYSPLHQPSARGMLSGTGFSLCGFITGCSRTPNSTFDLLEDERVCVDGKMVSAMEKDHGQLYGINAFQEPLSLGEMESESV
ncbi:hypothetical protein ACFFW8_15300 [Erwinia tracheiphila]|nr:hypothetical protein [Erwinia tracheiphila]